MGDDGPPQTGLLTKKLSISERRESNAELIYEEATKMRRESDIDSHHHTGGASTHGDGASQRRALLDLLFFCSVGDLTRVEELVKTYHIIVGDAKSCDYDKRYPLHLAASEGCYRVVEWLIKHGANVNVVDRFKHTPLEDAVRGDHAEVARILMENDGKIMHNGELVSLDHSGYAGYVQMYQGNFEADLEWECDPSSLHLDAEIGRGEFGRVYRARWYDSTVAVKVLNDNSDVALGDLRSELNVLRKTHHPHTMQCLGAVTSKRPYMIITEYMPMGSVADIFKKNINLGMRRSAEIALHTARGMAYLHMRRPSCIIHRDLKPANIMIGSSPYCSKKNQRQILGSLGVAKIADFGLSKSIPLDLRLMVQEKKKEDILQPEVQSVLKRVGSVAAAAEKGPSYKMTGETGSYRYMAPEVFRHEPYNRKVDVYSFAMIAYYLFTGLPPLLEHDPATAARLAALQELRPHWPTKNRWGDEVPQSLRQCVEKCWASDPELRPSFEEICVELQQIVNKLPAKGEDGPTCGCTVQ